VADKMHSHMCVHNKHGLFLKTGALSQNALYYNIRR